MLLAYITSPFLKPPMLHVECITNTLIYFIVFLHIYYILKCRTRRKVLLALKNEAIAIPAFFINENMQIMIQL